MAYPGQYNRNPPPQNSQYRPPPQQQQRPPAYGGGAAYGARPGAYAQYGAPPGGMGRGGPPGGYPPQYPPQSQPRPMYGGRPPPGGAPQYPPNTNFRQPHPGGHPGGPPPGAHPGMGRGGPNPTGQPVGPRPSGGPSYYGRPGGPGAPSALKRQASLLRSAYPNSRFCRVFLNTGGSTTTSVSGGGGGVHIPSDLTREVERPSIDYTFSYEETVLTEAVSSREADNANNQEFEHRASVRKNEEADGQLRKIAVLQQVTQRDANECRRLLEASDWNVDRATGLAFGSSDNLMEGASVSGGGGAETSINLMFPDGSSLPFRLPESHTFWELYGRIIQNKPEYGSRSFNFRLANGRTLTEANFDENLVQNFLTPSGTIWVVSN